MHTDPIAADKWNHGCWCLERRKGDPTIAKLEAKKAEESGATAQIAHAIARASKALANNQQERSQGQSAVVDGLPSSSQLSTAHQHIVSHLNELYPRRAQNPMSISAILNQIEDTHDRAPRDLTPANNTLPPQISQDIEEPLRKRARTNIASKSPPPFLNTNAQGHDAADETSTSIANPATTIASPTTILGSSNHEMSDAPQPTIEDLDTPKDGPATNLHHHTTVIIGGGAIGLATARQLALTAKENKVDHTVYLVDCMAELFTQSSGQGTGILNSEDLQPELQEFAQMTRQAFKTLCSSADFVAKTGFQAGSAFNAYSSDLDGAHLSPSVGNDMSDINWFKGKLDWGYQPQEGSYGLV